MPRHRKYGEETEVVSARVPRRLADRLNQVPDKSEYIARALEAQMGIYHDEFVSASILQIDEDLAYHRKCIDQDERRKAQLEAQLRSNAKRKEHVHDARIRTLEQYLKVPSAKKEAKKAWVECRLAECDWATPEEAVAWLEEQKVRVIAR